MTAIAAPPTTSKPRRRGRVAALALAAGVLMALSLPPAGWWPLGLVGLALLAGLLAGRPARTRAFVGALAGIGLYGITLSWLTQFNGVGGLVVMALEAAFLSLAAALTPPGWRRYGAWPAALVLTEALRGAVPFGGLPMGGVVLGQAAGPLAPATRLGGPLLLLAVAAVIGLGLEALARLAYDAARHGVRRLPRPALAGLALAAAIGVVVPAAGAAAADGRPVGTLRVAVVQGGGQRGQRAVDHPPSEVFAAQLRAEAHVAPPVDLVLWPENVIALDGPLVGSDAAAAVAVEARRLSATIVAGITEPSGDTRFLNAAVAWSPAGELVARYDKVHRVPFGEYIPFRSFLSHFVSLNAVPRDAIAGHGAGLLRTPAGPLGVVISYEVFFANRSRAAIRAGGQVLLVPTNTASYTPSQVPAAEIATAQLRAWETGRDVVMAAPTGFSAIVGPRGQLRARSGLGNAQVLTATVTRRTGTTPYLRLGDGPFVVGALAILVAMVGLALLDRPVNTSKP
jgi:apolipoprotein N-acyltransferase